LKVAGKIEGKVDQAKGRVRVAVGKVTGNRSTQLKGKAQQAKGKIKEKLGRGSGSHPGDACPGRRPAPDYSIESRREVS
jgi:uncharacterized protein YjbJ (UPF0337 family)